MEQEQKENNMADRQQEDQKDNIFSLEEVELEEMAIDGICGVY